MARELKAGDVVSLKSGGPDMTVNIARHDKCECVWFDTKGEKKNSIFSNETLALKEEIGANE